MASDTPIRFILLVLIIIYYSVHELITIGNYDTVSKIEPWRLMFGGSCLFSSGSYTTGTTTTLEAIKNC